MSKIKKFRPRTILQLDIRPNFVMVVLFNRCSILMPLEPFPALNYKDFVFDSNKQKQIAKLNYPNVKNQYSFEIYEPLQNVSALKYCIDQTQDPNLKTRSSIKENPETKFCSLCKLKMVVQQTFFYFQTWLCR